MTPLTDKLLAVPVPEMSEQFVIDYGYLIFKHPDMSSWITDDEIEKDAIRFLKTGKSKFSNMPDTPYFKSNGIPLPPGNYSILGLCSPKEVTFDCEPYVDSTSYTTDIDGEIFLYLDYPKHNFDWVKAADSFRSLLLSKGLELDKHYLIISKI